MTPKVGLRHLNTFTLEGRGENFNILGSKRYKYLGAIQTIRDTFWHLSDDPPPPYMT